MADDLRTPAQRLKAARIKAGFRSAASAAEWLGMRASTYNAHENGQNDIRPIHAERYADAFGVSAYWILFGREAPAEDAGSTTIRVPDPALVSAPVIGRVQAGFWQEIDLFEGEWPSVMQVLPDPRFAGRPHVTYEVAGDSYDLFVSDGGYVIAVPWAECGYLEPVAGMTVVAEQKRDGGLIQRTLKQVAGRPGRWSLVPQSRNPVHKPIALNGEAGEFYEVTIAALVVQFVNPAAW